MSSENISTFVLLSLNIGFCLSLPQEPIRPLEKRALNFLVNEYLLKNEYKLSSITFSDENDDQVKILRAIMSVNLFIPRLVIKISVRHYGHMTLKSNDMWQIALHV